MTLVGRVKKERKILCVFVIRFSSHSVLHTRLKSRNLLLFFCVCEFAVYRAVFIMSLTFARTKKLYNVREEMEL